jgi:hypothetical protein
MLTFIFAPNMHFLSSFYYTVAVMTSINRTTCSVSQFVFSGRFIVLHAMLKNHTSSDKSFTPTPRYRTRGAQEGVGGGGACVST